MKKIPISLILIGLAFYAKAIPIIEPLHEGDLRNGCGYYFEYPPSIGGTVLFWTDEKNAWMRINGELVKLHVKLEGRKSATSSKISIGDREKYLLYNATVRVIAETVVVGVCDQKQSECEAVKLKAHLTVKAPNGIKKINVIGGAGC